jgi:hypothetical protein
MTPSSAEYWHIGETAMRFFSVMSLRAKGLNSDAIGPFLLSALCAALPGYATLAILFLSSTTIEHTN